MSSISLDHLFSLTNEYRSMKYDLRNMQMLMDHLDNPQRSFRSILVAGTNGKGSVASMLSAMIPGSGLYTSPHLVKLNERIRIGSQEISDADLQAVYEQVFRAASEAKNLVYPPTYFELVTAMAFLYFKGRTNFAVLEVGLGGRLDATNVVRQDASVITSIGLDHQEFLGNMLDQIATEKAGIIKGHEPVIIGPEAEQDPICQQAGEHLFRTRHFHRTERSLGGGRYELDLVTPIRQYKGLRPLLLGRHQLDNVVVAVRAAECVKVPKERIEHGVNTAVWPGRLEVVPGTPSFLLDGAHNEMACGVLAEFLKEFHPGGVRIIFGCMGDKNYEAMLNLLKPQAREIIFTRGTNARFIEPSALLKLAPGARVEPSLTDAIAYVRTAASPEETVLVCGSLYLIGEARVLLQ
jgi:dihydrofolate synthase / folylpolyglutamate synthase